MFTRAHQIKFSPVFSVNYDGDSMFREKRSRPMKMKRQTKKERLWNVRLMATTATTTLRWIRFVWFLRLMKLLYFCFVHFSFCLDFWQNIDRHKNEDSLRAPNNYVWSALFDYLVLLYRVHSHPFHFDCLS